MAHLDLETQITGTRSPWKTAECKRYRSQRLGIDADPGVLQGLSRNLKNVCVQAVIIPKECAVATTRRRGNLFIDATH
jgi:hypothetical protein